VWFNRAKSGGHCVDVKTYMVNDVLRDAYDNPYMENIVQLIRTMLTL